MRTANPASTQLVKDIITQHNFEWEISDNKLFLLMPFTQNLGKVKGIERIDVSHITVRGLLIELGY